tara:strand:+ start:10262 stop:12571 length:2310 start_codon:yes stop_codon:yes gene_type:complete
MAEGFDRESIEQRNQALERSNSLLEKQIEALSRSADMSNTILDTLKEEMGIQTRRSTGEQNLLNINKKINKEINNQKFGLSNVATVNKQIQKNDELRKTALTTQKSLTQSLLDQGSYTAVADAKAANDKFNQLAAYQSQIDEVNAALERGEDIDENSLDTLYKKQDLLNEELAEQLKGMDSDSQRLALTMAQIDTLDTVNKKRAEELVTLDKMEETLGVMGKAMNFISKIPGIGKFAQDGYAAVIQQQKALAEAGQDLMDVNESAVFMGKELGKSLGQSIGDPFTLGLFAFNQLSKAITASDNKITGLQTQLGLSRGASLDIAQDMSQISASTGDAFTTSTKLAESFGEMSAQLGFAVDYSGQTLETFTTLNKRLGLSVEQSTALTSLLKLQGDNTEDQLDNLTQQIGAFNTLNGTAFDTKQVLGDIANTSAAIQISFAGSTDELASAVLESKKLGLSLESVDKVAESLLNFESSIENELKAELLIGKEINLEKARSLALNNDLAGVAEELAEQQVSFFEFSKMNRIQQEAIAGALGLGREEMSEMLLQQQRMTMTNDEISSQLKGQELSNFKQLTFQESMNAAVEKMQDIFVQIAEGPIGTIVGFISDMLVNSTALSSVFGALLPVMSLMAANSAIIAYQSLKSALSSVAAAVAKIFGASFALGPFGLGLATVGTAALFGSLSAAKQMVNDGIAPSSKGPFTITDAYGATAITAKGDGVAVSPNITRGGAGSSSRKMEMLLERLVAKESNIYMDSDKVGSAFARNATF